jgi:hypothetical protein
VNAPNRRYCRECGGSLGAACLACGFLNGFGDKHCGGCGRRLRGEEVPVAEALAGARPPALTGISRLGGEQLPEPEPAAGEAGGEDVSQSEIDGLFENMLEDDAGEGEP